MMQSRRMLVRQLVGLVRMPSVFSAVPAAYRPVGPGLQIFGLINLLLVINYAF